MQFSVAFPPLEQTVRPAVIYGVTNSITVDILDPETNEPVVPQTVINRPDPQGGEVSVTISDIPAGEWLMKAAAWEHEDGAGRMLSNASDTLTIHTGQTAQKSVVMDAWPYELIVIAGKNPLVVGETTQLTVIPRDVEGNTVLGDFTYSFVSDNIGVCTVSPNVQPTGSRLTPASGTGDATVEAIGRGSATITVTLLSEPGQPAGVHAAQASVSQTVDITVWPNVDEVVIEPAEATLYPDETVAITATARYGGDVVSDVDFTFISANDTVATVTKTGQNTAQITGVQAGSGLIEAHQDYTGAYGSCYVTVLSGGNAIVGY